MYDYVIVGAGSAGCVLAARLSEDPGAEVLLVEAGGTGDSPLVDMPVGYAALLRSDKDWDHMSGLEPHCDSRRLYLPRGRMLGGSSALNMMVYVRGHRADYDEWRDLGCTGWGYDDMLPAFVKSEDNVRGANDFHGTGGPLCVSDIVERHPYSAAYIDAALACGFAPNDDVNGAEQDGVGWIQTTIRDGVRASTAAAFLRPVLDRPNLHVETDVQVLKVLVEGTRAVGVVGQRSGELLEFRASTEVIVSGGAYNSPHLLMHSGIGPADTLGAIGIPAVSDLPSVGRNLVDHPVTALTYRSSQPISLFDAFSENNMTRYQQDREGPLASNGFGAVAFDRSTDGLPAPDLQYMCVHALFQQEGLVPGDGHGFTLTAAVNKPRSRGFVALRSPEPTAKPLIVNNYYADPDDMRVQIAGVRRVMRIARTEPLAGMISEPATGPASESDEDIAAYVRATCQTAYHPVGTCAMGTGDDAVVDPELRVRGVEGLRVVDASIMPTIVRGNTNAPTIAIAERAADLIRR